MFGKYIGEGLLHACISSYYLVCGVSAGYWIRVSAKETRIQYPGNAFQYFVNKYCYNSFYSYFMIFKHRNYSWLL